MKYVKSGILAFVFLILINPNLDAQPYRASVGARFWPTTALTAKFMLNDASGIEGILTRRWRGYRVIGMYEHHLRPAGNENFAFYFGGGGHVGYWKHVETLESTFLAGIDGIIGIEYTMDCWPINFSFDYKPFVELTGFNDRLHGTGAVSIRYYFD